ncbi:MgtC/SapB family protein [Roseococcus sp. YIM B11640]|uniref:MgtC/SapB family protein n=1 Tax=Roseococcus sp. YIM B11640 TaxID=3133973 RepID=UPI003C7B308F
MDDFLATAGAVGAAFLLGALIGAEREWRHHPGGLRSCAIVSSASAAYVLIMMQVGGNNLAAGLGSLVTGIGFLGAGVILRQGTGVRGLSTASTFWAVAAVGAACGAHLYALAVMLALAIGASHLLLRPISERIERAAPPPDDHPR